MIYLKNNNNNTNVNNSIFKLIKAYENNYYYINLNGSCSPYPQNCSQFNTTSQKCENCDYRYYINLNKTFVKTY